MYEEFLNAYVKSFRYEKGPRENSQTGVKI